VCEHKDGVFKKTAGELLGKARELVGDIGGEVTAFVFGDADGSSLGGWGASSVLQANSEHCSSYNTGPYTRALQAAVEAADPAVLLAPASPASKDSFPRLAARLSVGMATECVDLWADGGALTGRRPQYAGKVLSDVSVRSPLALFTVRPNSFPVSEPTQGTTCPVNDVQVVLDDGDLSANVVDTEVSASKVVDLTEAERIVSGGRAVASSDSYDAIIRPLAKALGATPGASRAAVDAGYAPHSHQVGQTGKVVNPSLYIACGISGAIQHLAGMRTSRVIVAINKDPEAPIFQHATYGIVGDIFDVCPMLTGAIDAAMD